MNAITGLTAMRPDVSAAAARLDKRVNDASQQFESVLLGQWMKDAASSFGSVPGADDDDTGGQMKEFGMQQVATELTRQGGIGIAKLVNAGLQRAAAHETSLAESATSSISVDHAKVPSGR